MTTAYDALTRAIQAVIANCGACGGSGVIVSTRTGYGHACGGDVEACSRLCPIPVPEQHEEQCEYCGRPAATILALRDSLATQPEPERSGVGAVEGLRILESFHSEPAASGAAKVPEGSDG